MIAMTTSNSMRVKAGAVRGFLCIVPGVCRLKPVCTTFSLKSAIVAAVVSTDEIAAGAWHKRLYNSSPLRHLFRKPALRAIGIVLQAKVFIDLKQPLPMSGGF